MKRIYLFITLLVLISLGLFLYYKKNTIEFVDKKIAISSQLFCEQQWLEAKKTNASAYNNGPSNLITINVDSDPDKETLGLCSVSPNGKGKGDLIKTVFIIDDSKHENALLYSNTDYEFQRSVVFENLRSEDVDKDGVDEIIYKSYGWSSQGGANNVFLYSPLHKQLFLIIENIALDNNGKVTKKVSFSKNIEKSPKLFVQLLEKELNEWSAR